MNKFKKFLLITLILFSIILFIIIKNNSKPYDLNTPISFYNIKNSKTEHLQNLKKNIYPIKLRNFILNNYINLGLYSEDATIKDLLYQMKFKGYKILFTSLFDKTRTNFDDCPVTDNFKNKFNTNLLDYYNLKRSDDAEVNCSLDMENKKFDLEVYGIIGRSLNLEPNYYDTHHFTYTLDADGNVDDVVFNQK